MPTVITVKNIGKRYTLRHQQREEYSALRDVITNGFTSLGKKLTRPFRRSLSPGSLDIDHAAEDFWALKNVSFQIKQGERIGIIGRNGAGKSTLLKILSRITEPTTGSVRIKGRVASLLEVGTGFHPELTGRENIFLNGAILGMRRAEIKRKFDEIVDFAEIEKFLDTPVKHYSSGMYVRLAFAVAAHLEPEILIVDEVLAVGDVQFQRKCLGKMEGVSQNEGRTVIFVSHNMEAISTLCNRGIVLAAGTLHYYGEIAEAIASYTDALHGLDVSIDNCQSRAGSGGITIQDVWLAGSDGTRINRVTSDSSASLRMSAQVEPRYQGGKRIAVGFGIDNIAGRRLFTAVSSWENTSIATSGEHLEVACSLPSIPLVPGRYLVSTAILFQTDTLDSIIHSAGFEVTEGERASYAHRGREHGDLHFPATFTYR